VAGLSFALLALVGAVAWVASRPDTYVAPPPDTSDPKVSPGSASDTLDALVSAVRDRDPDAAAELAAGDGDAEKRLRTLATNAERLEVERFSMSYVDEATGISPDGTWAGAVDATWAFRDFDEQPARAEVLVTFQVGEERGSPARIVSVGGGDRHSPLWMAGPVTVRRTGQTLVQAADGVDGIDRYVRFARAAVPVVARVLPRWRPRLVVEVPADRSGLESALAADPETYSAIAAVTSSPDGTTAPTSPVHVFLNPEVFGDLQPVGAQVVMSHEAAHVATAGPSSRAEPWLLEGVADYIALRDVKLPMTTTARQIIQAVRKQGVPDTLPDRDDFRTDDTHLGAAYEAAWLACVVLAERGGEQALMRLYRQASEGAKLGPVLKAEFGWTEEELVAAWQQKLRLLAR
jgi:hypothetical protein